MSKITRPPLEDFPPFSDARGSLNSWTVAWARWLNSIFTFCTGKYNTALTAATTVTITHGLNTTAVVVQAFDGTGLLVAPSSVQVTGANTIDVTFGSPFTGTIVVVG